MSHGQLAMIIFSLNAWWECRKDKGPAGSLTTMTPSPDKLTNLEWPLGLQQSQCGMGKTSQT